MLWLSMKGAVMKVHKIAVLAGDGIGKEVMPEGIRAVEAAARRFNIAIEVDHV
jgi:tartrate dehydrogenase/decarboxylase/D-malate dehydrogenase